MGNQGVNGGDSEYLSQNSKNSHQTKNQQQTCHCHCQMAENTEFLANGWD